MFRATIDALHSGLRRTSRPKRRQSQEPQIPCIRQARCLSGAEAPCRSMRQRRSHPRQLGRIAAHDGIDERARCGALDDCRHTAWRENPELSRHRVHLTGSASFCVLLGSTSHRRRVQHPESARLAHETTLISPARAQMKATKQPIRASSTESEADPPKMLSDTVAEGSGALAGMACPRTNSSQCSTGGCQVVRNVAIARITASLHSPSCGSPDGLASTVQSIRARNGATDPLMRSARQSEAI
ncbi:hypothetical protein SAMN05444161_8482 [Rhizobiales bacterium GAS191]|nr:hypothetical protein SAMN05444161_8482 [Rhizobiales bacterium GAS191]